MLSRGIIISIQGYSVETTEEMIIEVANAGAVAIRTDKKCKSRLPLIGLHKIKVKERIQEAYITPTLEAVKEVEKWSKIIAIDYRRLNSNLKEISDYCREKELVVIADIGKIEDYENILKNDYYYSYVATTLAVLYGFHHGPDLDLVERLKNKGCENIIAEGRFNTRSQVKRAFNLTAHNVCIGDAVTGVFRLAKKFTTVRCV